MSTTGPKRSFLKTGHRSVDPVQLEPSLTLAWAVIWVQVGSRTRCQCPNVLIK
jgi:hypothetical protein